MVVPCGLGWTSSILGHGSALAKPLRVLAWAFDGRLTRDV
jgi:hypothetical protein